MVDRTNDATQPSGFDAVAKERALGMEAARRFHALPLPEKHAIAMDQPHWPIGGMGYLPIRNRKLPHRATGNENEAFIVKCDGDVGLADNQWPTERSLPGFRSLVTELIVQLETLALSLLPICARALGPANPPEIAR